MIIITIEFKESNMAEIEIGKFTLESLTTGMYNDPEIVYREYIQNAVDSFDNAVEQKIMTADDCRIEIIVDADRQEISIKDNGTGISKEKAVKTLLDIGNSSKPKSPVGKSGAAQYGIERYSIGQRVRHAMFGEGSILSSRDMGGDVLYEVKFDSGETKKLMATFARLEKI